MDRTAIAAIIIGVGATAAAMVMPLKYPKAPKWSIDLSWWGGLFLIFVGALFLTTDDLGGVFLKTFGWIKSHVVLLLGLPASWVVIAFLAGIAVHRWYSSFWKELPLFLSAAPEIAEWLTPIQAVEKFVSPELLSADRAAQEKAGQLREKVQSLEAKLTEELGPDRAAALREQLASEIEERDSATYIATRRRADIIDFLRKLLKSGLLVGKGCKIVKKGDVWVKQNESHIPVSFWGVIIDQTDVLDLNLQRALGYFGRYDDVLIGKMRISKNRQPNLSPTLPFPVHATG